MVDYASSPLSLSLSFSLLELLRPLPRSTDAAAGNVLIGKAVDRWVLIRAARRSSRVIVEEPLPAIRDCFIPVINVCNVSLAEMSNASLDSAHERPTRNDVKAIH
jgi:hypothetical protein